MDNQTQECMVEIVKEIAELHKQLSESYELLASYLYPEDEDENELEVEE